MPAGTVLKFFDDRGFGFVKMEDGREAFVHRTAIQGTGYRILVQGEPVEVAELREETHNGKPRLTVASVGMAEGRMSGVVKAFDHGRGFGHIIPDGGGEDVFFHFSEILMNERSGTATAREGDEVEFNVEPSARGPKAFKIKRRDYRLPLYRFAKLGHEQTWLDDLASKVESEHWGDYTKRSGQPDEKPILRSYITYTFARLEEENKIEIGGEGNHRYAAFNTGLVTTKQEPVHALFEGKSKGEDGCPWQLTGFFSESDRHMVGKFSKMPELANYFDDPTVLLYDRRCDLVIDIDHIIEDNLKRFPESARDNPYLAQQLLEAARRQTEKRVYRNYKTAIPQFHRGSVQLLLPLCLIQPERADLALVVSREGQQYLGSTVLTLDMAYNNARLLCRPDSDWLNP
jgi:cold shock CspA family protein